MERTLQIPLNDKSPAFCELYLFELKKALTSWVIRGEVMSISLFLSSSKGPAVFMVYESEAEAEIDGVCRKVWAGLQIGKEPGETREREVRELDRL